MVLELVSGADCRCLLHHFSSLARLKGSWGQAWPESGPKPNISPTQYLLSSTLRPKAFPMHPARPRHDREWMQAKISLRRTSPILRSKGALRDSQRCFLTRTYIRKLTSIFWFWSVLGRFSAKLGPKTPLNGSGSKNGVERTQNQPRRPIIVPFRDHFLSGHQN